jgi:putative phosphoesterase
MLRKILFIIILILSLEYVNASCESGSDTSIEQYGITWTFDSSYQCGIFANGDYWVIGPVTITSITPDFDGSHHGWMVNMDSEAHGYESRAYGFDANLVPSLPYYAEPGESIVKAITIEPLTGSCRPCLKTAAVLTVVPEVPLNNGEGVFRPPFFGDEKPYYYVDDLNLEMLISAGVEPPADVSVDDFSWITERFKKLQLDIDSYPGEGIRPFDNYQRNGYVGYGGSLALTTGDAALRFMLNDELDDDKKQDLIYFIQHGIDLYHTMLGGMDWEGNGGHGSGRKLTVIFTAVLFENDTWKQNILDQPETTFQEDDYLFFSEKADNGRGKVLFGDSLASEYSYWFVVVEDGHHRTAGDPYEYIDCGHVPGTSYQAGINSMIWKGPVIAMQLMPEIKELWNNDMFFTYVDRWFNHGTWAAPDPCAPVIGYCVGGPNDGELCSYGDEDDGALSIPEEEAFCGDGHCVGGVCDPASPYAGQLCSYEVKPGEADGTTACGRQPNGNYYRCNANPEFYSVVYGPDPDNPGDCIKDTDPSNGIGRFPKEHGQRANEGGYHSSFVDSMWDLYRDHVDPCKNNVQDPSEDGVDCGDLCSSYLVEELSKSGILVYLACGNMDKPIGLKIECEKYENVSFVGEVGKIVSGEKKIAFCHYPHTAKNLISKSKLDVVFYGHTHIKSQEMIGKTLFLNPGEVVGKYYQASCAFFDTDKKECGFLMLL